MSFKTLEQRYTEKVKDLYKGATSKFENGKPSRGRNDDPLIVRQPGKGYWNFAEGRMTPLRSTFEDIKRLTLFSVSVRGIRFLAKQQLLQTGNTFEQTRLLNPGFVIGNAVPFLHIKRNLRPVRNLIGKTDTSYANVKTLGQLQVSTYDKLVSGASSGLGGFLKQVIKSPIQTISAVTAKRNVGEKFEWSQSRPELGENDGQYFLSKLLLAPPEKSSDSRFSSLNSIGLFKFGGSTNTPLFNGQKYGAINTKSKWDGKYTTYLNNSNNEQKWNPVVGKQFSDYKNGSPVRPEQNLTNTDEVSELNGIVANSVRQSLLSSTESSLLTEYKQANITEELITKQAKEFAFNALNDGLEYIKYFTYGVGSVIGEKTYTTENGIPSQNSRDLAKGKKTLGKLQYIKDPINLEQKDVNENLDLPYNRLKSTENINDLDDPIVVSIAMGNKAPVQFRAFIKDLQQTATPEYKTYQYIGRMEKFINYLGVQREITFKLGIVAFSADELDVVWKKINYLTGLVYPYGYNRGIMQPNIAKLTIGKVFLDQPGYFTSLNFNFNQLAESWDIRPDKKVPIGAEVDMRFTLIEKHSKTALSPFYGITEKMDEFPTPPVTTQTEEKDAPANQPLNVPVESANSAVESRYANSYISRDEMDMQGFDAVDRNMTDAIFVAYKAGDNQTVSRIGDLQARRREAFRAGRPY